MRLFIAMLITVLVVAGLTAGGFVLLDSQTADNGGTVAIDGGTGTPPDDPGGSSRPRGSTRVTGTVTLVHAEPGALDPVPVPLEVVTPERGSGGANFEGVTIGGEPGSIVWDAGQPLRIEGEGGALLLDPAIVDIGPDGIVVSLDGTQGVAQGRYDIVTPVAVGTVGLAEPLDSVAFEASEAATVTFRGGTTTTLAPQPLALRGPGAVVLEGALTVQDASATVEAARVDFASAPFEITLTPVDGGYTVEAILQGPVTTS